MLRALLGAIWSPDDSRVRPRPDCRTDAIDLMLECQGNYCNHAFSLTLASAKRDNEPITTPLFRALMNRHNLRRTLCVVLVASLLAPSFGFGQPQPAPSPSPAPSTPGRSVTTPTPFGGGTRIMPGPEYRRSEEHTSELQSLAYLVCRLLLEKKKTKTSTLNG